MKADLAIVAPAHHRATLAQAVGEDLACSAREQDAIGADAHASLRCIDDIDGKFAVGDADHAFLADLDSWRAYPSTQFLDRLMRQIGEDRHFSVEFHADRRAVGPDHAAGNAAPGPEFELDGFAYFEIAIDLRAQSPGGHVAQDAQLVAVRGRQPGDLKNRAMPWFGSLFADLDFRLELRIAAAIR
nr:hypothetical protein [Sphingomonas bacterium]